MHRQLSECEENKQLHNLYVCIMQQKLICVNSLWMLNWVNTNSYLYHVRVIWAKVNRIFVTNSLNKQTCLDEARLFINYTDLTQGTNTDELFPEQTKKTWVLAQGCVHWKRGRSRAECWKHRVAKQKDWDSWKQWKPQRVRQSCCCVPVLPASSHSWDNKRRTNLLTTDNSIHLSSRVSFMQWINGYILWCNLRCIRNISAGEVDVSFKWNSLSPPSQQKCVRNLADCWPLLVS